MGCLLGIKFSAIPAASLIMAIGLAVEFTAHMVTAFEAAQGDRDERVITAMEEVFWPIMYGCVSSVLSVGMLGFSPIPFIVKFFFLVFMVLFAVSLLNGLVFLPVLLSIAGPMRPGVSKALHDAREEALGVAKKRRSSMSG